MSDASDNYASEMERLRKIESSDQFEPFLRMLAVGLAGLLISIYTEWLIPLVWAIYYAVAILMHRRYIATRKAFVSRNEVFVSAALFANLQIAFVWLPVTLFISPSRELLLVGAVLIGTQLLFLVRRSDTLNIYNIIQIVGLICTSIIVFIGFLPDLETPIALTGAALALVGLNYYFWQSLRTARHMRIDQELSAQQAHQAKKIAAIGQLAGGVAHDFNNNLTAIMGSLELLQMANDLPDHQEDIDNAMVAARQAANTVSQLMLFARVEKPSLVTVDLREILDDLDKLTKRLIPTSINCDISVHDSGMLVRVDRHQLLSGLINLVVNSIDAMPQGGLLMIEARSVCLNQHEALADGSKLPPGRYAKIAVSDTGHGIPAKILPEVINPFFTTKPVGKGTGLGLSMVAGMIREVRGGLSIQSESGRTSVALFLPFADSD